MSKKIDTQPISTKEILLQAAKKMFRENGYAGTSMRDLAKEVNLEAPSLYNYFASKDAILQEICFEMATAFFAKLELVSASEKSTSKRLKKIIEGHISVIASHADASQVFFQEWTYLKDPHLSKFKLLRNKYENQVRELIQNGINEGDFKVVNVRLATLTIFSALNAIHELYRTNEKISVEEISENLTTLLLKGLKK